MLLSEKIRREARDASRLLLERSTSGLPNHIRATYLDTGVVAWSGHRDLAPATVRLAHDPLNLLTRPTSD